MYCCPHRNSSHEGGTEDTHISFTPSLYLSGLQGEMERGMEGGRDGGMERGMERGRDGEHVGEHRIEKIGQDGEMSGVKIGTTNVTLRLFILTPGSQLGLIAGLNDGGLSQRGSEAQRGE